LAPVPLTLALNGTSIGLLGLSQVTEAPLLVPGTQGLSALGTVSAVDVQSGSEFLLSVSLDTGSQYVVGAGLEL
jgi:hypothetical protein